MADFYRVWFGKFRGSALVSLMFQPGGWMYMSEFLAERLVTRVDIAQRLLGNGVKARDHRLVLNTKELLRKGEQLRVVHKCGCGQPVKYFMVSGDEQNGYSFQRDQLFCEACRPGFLWDSQRLVEVKMSALKLFRKKADQAQCLKMLRWLIGLDGRLTDNRAAEYWDSVVGQPPIQTEVVQLERKLLPPGSWMATLAPELLEAEEARPMRPRQSAILRPLVRRRSRVRVGHDGQGKLF